MQELEFLERLNDGLHSLERELSVADVTENFPNLYILGLPRTGSSLLSQVLFNYLDVCCPNGLIARFWKTPLVGFFFSNLLLGNTKDSTFSSYYGQPVSIFSPHEYSWFWHRLLSLPDFPLGPEDSLSNTKVDWESVRRVIANINLVVGKPVVYKPLELLGYQLEGYSEALEHSFFIYLERDPLDVACSLAKARVDRCGSLDKWWGSYPREFNGLLELPWEEQIAGQVALLLEMYEEKFELINQDRVLRFNYTDLCEDPNGLLDQVKDRVVSVSGFKINQSGSAEPFAISTPSVDPSIRKMLQKALDCLL